MKIGYARVSTTAQNPQLQLDALTAAGVDEADVYVDHASGSTMARPQLEAALRQLRGRDVLVVWKLDRLARSTTELIRQVRHLEERGVEFVSRASAIRMLATAPPKVASDNTARRVITGDVAGG